MCGILGIYNLDGAKVDRKTINKMEMKLLIESRWRGMLFE